MKTKLPKLWHCFVTKENKLVLEKWRGGVKLRVGNIVGICYEYSQMPSHNPGTDIKCSSGDFDFGEEITFDEFRYLVLGEKNNSLIYGIY